MFRSGSRGKFPSPRAVSATPVAAKLLRKVSSSQTFHPESLPARAAGTLVVSATAVRTKSARNRVPMVSSW
jgi:hypothetical protein